MPLCDLALPLIAGLLEFCLWPSDEAMLGDFRKLSNSIDKLYWSEEESVKAKAADAAGGE